jgi:hypothetical protein
LKDKTAEKQRDIQTEKMRKRKNNRKRETENRKSERQKDIETVRQRDRKKEHETETQREMDRQRDVKAN